MISVKKNVEKNLLSVLTSELTTQELDKAKALCDVICKFGVPVDIATLTEKGKKHYLLILPSQSMLIDLSEPGLNQLMHDNSAVEPEQKVDFNTSPDIWNPLGEHIELLNAVSQAAGLENNIISCTDIKDIITDDLKCQKWFLAKFA